MLNKISSLKALISPLTAFFAGTIFVSAAYGLLNSTLAINLTDAGVNTFYSGIILSMYYVGYIFATINSYKIINTAGHIRAFSAYVSILSALVLMHSLYINAWYWGILRLLEGYCMASAIICLESWLNTRSNNKNRGMIMSLYMITSYLGAASGQLFLNIPDKLGFITFILISILYSIALVPISLTALPSPDIKQHKSMSFKQLYKIAPVGVVGCIVSGILVGNVYTLGTIYAEKSGLDMAQISLFMFFTILGGMLIQFPIGRLSDRMDRRFVMMWTSGGLFLIAPWIQLFINEGLVQLVICGLLLGAGTFILYPICVSHINDKIEDDERTEAAGMLIMLQSLGMIGGPIAVSFAMQLFGNISFLIAFSIANGFFVLFALRFIAFRPNAGYITVTKTDPIPLTPTHVYTEITTPDTLIDKAKSIFTDKH